MNDRDELARTFAEISFTQARFLDGDQARLLDLYWAAAPAHLFNETGKWKYEVKLDYRKPPEGYTTPRGNAVRALKQATANGTSGVSISDIPDGWRLVVFEPPEGFPVMVTGGAR